MINRKSENGRRTARSFSKSKAKEHIMVLELQAVKLALLDFVEECKSRNVRLLEENQAVVAILKSLTTKHAGLMAELRLSRNRMETRHRDTAGIHPLRGQRSSRRTQSTTRGARATTDATKAKAANDHKGG